MSLLLTALFTFAVLASIKDANQRLKKTNQALMTALRSLKSEWSCEKERNCEDASMLQGCGIDTKEDNWDAASSLEGCQIWADATCNAKVVVFWPGNWCSGYSENCPFGEKDYPFGNVDFCTKTETEASVGWGGGYFEDTIPPYTEEDFLADVARCKVLSNAECMTDSGCYVSSNDQLCYTHTETEASVGWGGGYFEDTIPPYTEEDFLADVARCKVLSNAECMTDSGCYVSSNDQLCYTHTD